jgi:hypothetical protein
MFLCFVIKYRPFSNQVTEIRRMQIYTFVTISHILLIITNMIIPATSVEGYD